ncbi:Hypothetical protein BN2458_PEG1812 [Helicobacter typhlonius]|uniref:Sodium-dependent transporter n=4 Tax=Helicobacter typhlonius TaxID=76936 RepID=A0A0S4PY92_9HELI|nr:Hypothetical protein BN2458_PEG1812 [Helicobacter typhlonius]
MLCVLLFLGWYIKVENLRKWTPYLPNTLFFVWLWILRIVAPGIILVIFISQLFSA